VSVGIGGCNEWPGKYRAMAEAVVIRSVLVQTMIDAPPDQVAAKAGAWLAEIRAALEA